jgi:hypothetical protein
MRVAVPVIASVDATGALGPLPQAAKTRQTSSATKTCWKLLFVFMTFSLDARVNLSLTRAPNIVKRSVENEAFLKRFYNQEERKK